MTNTQLIPVSSGVIGSTQCLTVDGRVLHGTLGIRRDFSSWIKTRITKYDFIEGQDYEKKFNDLRSPNLGSLQDNDFQMPVDYTLTLDMGKELCMVENNEKGRVARRYFIECERHLLSNKDHFVQQDKMVPRLSLPTDPERKALHKLVKVWAGMIGGSPAETMPRLNTQVASSQGVTTVDEMTITQVKQAIEWVQAKIDAAQIKPLALPQAGPTALDIDHKMMEVRMAGRKLKDVSSEAYRMLYDAASKNMGQDEEKRTMVVNSITTMDKLHYALDAIVDALEPNARVLKAAARV